MSMHPLDIIKRDMAVAKTLTDRPRRPSCPPTLRRALAAVVAVAVRYSGQYLC